MIKFIISILSIFLTIGYAMALFDYGIIDYHTSRFYYFIIGAMAFIPIWYLWLKKVSFYSTFEHELTHLLVGLIFFKKPTHFWVSRQDGGQTGYISHSDSNNFLISLAPYFLPTFAIIILPLYIVISSQYQLGFLSVFGFFVSYHILSTIQEFSYEQPDIYTTGKLFSTIFLIFANLLFYGYIYMFIEGGFSLGNEFIREGVLNSYHQIEYAISLIRNSINELNLQTE